MFKKSILKGMALSLLLMTSQSVFAIVILDFTSNTQTVLLGGQASVDITASNLQNEFIGEFDFNVNWDSSILSLSGISFGNALGGGGAFSLQGTTDVQGMATLAETSLVTDLTSLQTGTTDIILATLVFNTLNVGSSALTLTGNIDGGFLGDEIAELLATEANSGLVNVVSSSVSEPGTLLLMGIGLLTFLSGRRRTNL